MTRLRDHGLRTGALEPGPLNAITDVTGVAVGHVTVQRDEPDSPAGRGVARTGVTAVLPGPVGELFDSPAPAGAAVLNGAGELAGFLQVREWGLLETPVYLTATMSVGRVLDGAVSVALAADARIGVTDVVIPVVGECDDSWLSDARTVQVEAVDAGRAVESAMTAAVEEGCVGAGTGMIALGWKGGIGTASRRVPRTEALLGALVLANFGEPRDLRVDGVSPFAALGQGYEEAPPPAGSCIVVVATDAPLSAAQLTRVARRCGLGLARTGSVAHHGSGEIFVACSTARRPRDEPPAAGVADPMLDGFFAASVEATEEAVLNALWAAVDTTGRDGRVVRALPHDATLELLAAHGRLGT
ncbi:MAG TPA: P1 family peptidase [Gaiellaceae bacterium]|jgi:D-aminopeptidase